MAGGLAPFLERLDHDGGVAVFTQAASEARGGRPLPCERVLEFLVFFGKLPWDGLEASLDKGLVGCGRIVRHVAYACANDVALNAKYAWHVMRVHERLRGEGLPVLSAAFENDGLAVGVGFSSREDVCDFSLEHVSLIKTLRETFPRDLLALWPTFPRDF